VNNKKDKKSRENDLAPSEKVEGALRGAKRFIPRQMFSFFQPTYHYLLSIFAALWYKFPARDLIVIAVTGTKGKSTTVELLLHLLRAGGLKVAGASTVRFTIDKKEERNLYKMTLPGRFFLQRFLYNAKLAGCTHAVIEITSESVSQYRHKWLFLNALVFTNLSPEHIESHGSYEKYIEAKLDIARELEHSKKGNRVIVVNGDDNESQKFLSLSIPRKLNFELDDTRPFALESTHARATIFGKPITFPLPGEFNILNALGASMTAKEFGVSEETIRKALSEFEGVKGRVERVIQDGVSVPFDVIVDYAHTPDSLEKLYRAFPGQRKVCVLGNTGGGRDKWKRALMGGIAGYYCDEIILTNEDPYDEDPLTIVVEMATGIKKKKYEILMDRRLAIREALKRAGQGDIVLISGKGTDPYIMGAKGTKEPWDDATVVREELTRLASL